MTDIIKIQKEIKQELEKKEVLKALISTTFKKLEIPQIYMAIQEGMMRGFQFKDFLEKNVYAVPFGSGYSLITSIDYARKIAMRSGLAGKSAPLYTFKDEVLETCTITIKRNVDGYVGDYTATVYFDEYTTGKNLWISKPKTMIAKVAEMHALRAGFPEEMAKQYIEEEMEQETISEAIEDNFQKEIDAIKTIDELKVYWGANKGRGKAFDKAITLKKQLLENENKTKNS